MPAAFVSSVNTAMAATASTTVAKPASVVSGTLLVAMHSATTSLVADMLVTGGGTWNSTQALSLTTNALSCRISWRFAGGSEPATYTVTHTSTSSNGVMTMVAISGANPSMINPVYGTVASATSAATTITCPTATPVAADDLQLRYACGSGGASCTWSFAAESPVATSLTNIQVATLRANQLVSWRQLASGAAVGTNVATSTFSQTNRIAHTILIPSAPAAAAVIPELIMGRYS